MDIFHGTDAEIFVWNKDKQDWDSVGHALSWDVEIETPVPNQWLIEILKRLKEEVETHAVDATWTWTANPFFVRKLFQRRINPNRKKIRKYLRKIGKLS